MIDRGANNQHIRDWASERDLKLTISAVKAHKVKHYGYIKLTQPSSSIDETVKVTLSVAEEILNIGDELFNYFSARNLEPQHRKKYDVIDMMRFFTDQLNSKVNLLQLKLNELAPTSEKKAMTELKIEKSEAQTRLLKAIAKTREIDLKIALGELVPSLKLESQRGYSLVGFKAKLLSMPTKLSLEL